jgi:hypothetical protein
MAILRYIIRAYLDGYILFMGKFSLREIIPLVECKEDGETIIRAKLTDKYSRLLK